MHTKIITLVLVAGSLIAGCAKKNSAPEVGDPASAVTNAIAAINNHDSVALKAAYIKSDLEYVYKNDDSDFHFSDLFSDMKGITLKANILSTRIDSMVPNVGFVKFSVTLSGKVSGTTDTVLEQVYKEDNVWKTDNIVRNAVYSFMDAQKKKKGSTQ